MIKSETPGRMYVGQCSIIFAQTRERQLSGHATEDSLCPADHTYMPLHLHVVEGGPTPARTFFGPMIPVHGLLADQPMLTFASALYTAHIRTASNQLPIVVVPGLPRIYRE